MPINLPIPNVTASAASPNMTCRNPEYLHYFPCIQTSADQELFVYYKCMRANIRAKVHAISAGQSVKGENRDLHLAPVRGYLGLVKSYVGVG